MSWQTGISGIHRDIAADPGSPVHVLAGPGTGKTKAMMHRVARMLEDGVNPKRILAVTFTRTAARDLEQQLLALDSPGAELVRTSTLHSLCFSALLADAVFRATGRTARPLLSYEIDQLINDLKSAFGGKRRTGQLIEAYEAAWARLQHQLAGAPQTAEDQAFEAALLDWLRYHRTILVGELVPITLRFLQDNPAEPVLPLYDAVLVDEYQDLNKADQSLVEVLARQGTLTVVGDDNQSIYSFRYANPEGIRTFPSSHAGTSEYVIEECWRCPPNIVEMSNALIAHDPAVRPTPLQPQSGRPDATVHVVQHDGVADEADAIAAFIDKYLLDRPSLTAGQILVLSPRRIFGNAVRDSLIRRRRNAMSFFWEDALDSDPAAEGFCVLTLLVKPNDRAAYRAWLGIDHPEGRTNAYRRVRKYAEENNLEPFDVVERLAAGNLTLPYTGKLLQRHEDLKHHIKSLANLAGVPLVAALWPDSIAENRTIRVAASTVALSAPEPEDLLSGLTEAITRPELPDSMSDVIRIMSLHKSKGLTAALVVIVGCSSGAIPSVNPKLPPPQQDTILKEQRRLFYVAITRAKDTLILSSVTTLPLATALQCGIAPARILTLAGEKIARIAATPFLAELGPRLPASVRGADWRAAEGI